MRMRKTTLLWISLLLAISVFPTATFAADGQAVKAAYDESAIAKGVVGVRVEADKTKTIKARVTKSGSSYIYSLKPSATGWLPLQLGDGPYKVEVLEQVSGTKYRLVDSRELDVEVSNAKDVYLNSIQLVNWKVSVKAVAKAKELTKNSKSAAEKVAVIYGYVTSSIKYDKELAAKVASDYVPDIDGTLKSGKAICYGYAALTAAMLRSQGIPAKLVMGTTTAVKGYHAWNEVLVNGKWVVLDTTVDAGLKQGGKKVTMYKKAADYKAAKWY